MAESGGPERPESSATGDETDTGPLIPVRTVVIALVVLVALAVAALVAARMLLPDTGVAQDEPISVPSLPQPNAESPECAAFVEGLPDTLGDAEQVEILDPVPAGTAAYRLPDGDPLTVRCGMEPPPTFDAASAIQVVSDVEWFHEDDPDEYLPNTTWVTVDRVEYVALTMPRETGTGPIQDVSEAIADLLEYREPEPAPIG